MSLYANATNNNSMIKQIEELKKINVKMYDMMKLFAHFFNNSWVYKQTLIDDYLPLMTK